MVNFKTILSSAKHCDIFARNNFVCDVFLPVGCNCVERIVNRPPATVDPCHCCPILKDHNEELFTAIFVRNVYTSAVVSAAALFPLFCVLPTRLGKVRSNNGSTTKVSNPHSLNR